MIAVGVNGLAAFNVISNEPEHNTDMIPQAKAWNMYKDKPTMKESQILQRWWYISLWFGIDWYQQTSSLNRISIAIHKLNIEKRWQQDKSEVECNCNCWQEKKKRGLNCCGVSVTGVGCLCCVTVGLLPSMGKSLGKFGFLPLMDNNLGKVGLIVYYGR